ncbi:MAG: acetyl-CoA acetyltransferase [Deltaproteobacteria bacterium]|nr:acetyl-CoA acetyltransferase [Deltaproteobacteria bacterium]
MVSENIPVIIGAGQVTKREAFPVQGGSPVDLMAEAVMVAAEESGLTQQALTKADMIITTSLFSDDGIINPPGCVADKLNLADARCMVSGFGGTTPHSMLHHAMKAIAENRASLVIITGAEAQHTRQQAVRTKTFTGWGLSSQRSCLPPLSPVGPIDGACETEHIHDLSIPAYVYPMFENALRRRYGRTVAAHAQVMGELMSRLSRVAAQNPHAWFQESFTPEEIVTVSDTNRNTAFPYTKRMNAMLLVNQAAALIVTSEKQAGKMGIDRSKWVYVHGYAEAHDHWHVLEREAYGVSPAIDIVGRTALVQAGVNIGEIDFFDLYSCFPVSVQVTRDMLGISENDSRSLTVTGGLPYFGGPGNNYVMHSMAGMVNVLRHHPGKTGLVTGNSFYMTKHSAAICTTRPLADSSAATADISQCQKAVDQRPKHKIDPTPSGRATVEAYTVVYDRNNSPNKGIVIGKKEDGKRFAAHTPPDPDLFSAMMREDFCGVGGKVVSTDKVNTFTPD